MPSGSGGWTWFAPILSSRSLRPVLLAFARQPDAHAILKKLHTGGNDEVSRLQSTGDARAPLGDASNTDHSLAYDLACRVDDERNLVAILFSEGRQRHDHRDTLVFNCKSDQCCHPQAHGLRWRVDGNAGGIGARDRVGLAGDLAHAAINVDP